MRLRTKKPTERTLVDVYKETIMLRIGDQKIEFPAVAEKCSAIYELTRQPAVEE